MDADHPDIALMRRLRGLPDEKTAAPLHRCVTVDERYPLQLTAGLAVIAFVAFGAIGWAAYAALGALMAVTP